MTRRQTMAQKRANLDRPESESNFEQSNRRLPRSTEPLPEAMPPYQVVRDKRLKTAQCSEDERRDRQEFDLFHPIPHEARARFESFRDSVPRTGIDTSSNSQHSASAYNESAHDVDMELDKPNTKTKIKIQTPCEDMCNRESENLQGVASPQHP